VGSKMVVRVSCAHPFVLPWLLQIHAPLL
jgi:hypothetical protein